MKSSIQKLEDSIEFTQGEVETLKEQVKENLKQHKREVELLHQEVAELELKLKEVERKTNIEQYTRKENLKFNKIPELEDENCKTIIYDVISSLGVDTSEIRFDAVQRVWKKAKDRCRRIIPRFVCRDYRNRVWLERGKVKQSRRVYNGGLRQSHARRKEKVNKIDDESQGWSCVKKR